MSVESERYVRLRERWIKAGAHEFLIRRPAPMAAIGRHWRDVATEAVVGWREVSEADVFRNGNASALKFDADLAKEWLLDRADLFARVADEIEKSMEEYKALLANAEKNSG